MQVYVPALPKRLQITQTMVEDFLFDPVLAARVLLGYDLDVFQRVRLKIYWFVPNVVDSSGYSSGKTICNFIFCNLRALLLPNHVVGVYYPRFEQGKKTFWEYFYQCKHPLFRAQLGNEDRGKQEKGNEAAACFTQYYQNGNRLLLPAPDWDKKSPAMASMRYNTGLLDEYTQVDDREKGRETVDEQFMGRMTAESYNQNHPVWANHVLFTAPARTRNHASWQRAREFIAKAEQGDPDFAHISFNFKDYSELRSNNGRSYRDRFRVEKNIALRRTKMDHAAVLGDIYGIWANSGKGWYGRESLDRCVELGRVAGLRPELGGGVAGN